MKFKRTKRTAGKRQRTPRTRLFMFIFVCTLVLVVVNQVFVNIKSGRDQVYRQSIADLRVLSQELAKNASSVATGDSAAFAALAQSRESFQSVMDLVNGGRDAYIDTGVGIKVPLPGQQAVIDGSYPEIGATWAAISRNVELILANRDKMQDINAQAENIRNVIPVMQREYEEVVNTLLDDGQSLSTTAVAQRQAWLAERIALNMNLILAGESSTTEVDQFKQDINLFSINHESLRLGDRTLGINRVTDSGAQQRLEEISGLFAGIEEPAANILAAVPDINAVNTAIDLIVNSSETLLADITGLGGVLAVGAGGGLESFASPVAGYALLLVMLLTISAYGVQVIRQSREAEQSTAEKNARNNQAVVNLLDEISSLADGDLTVQATVGEDFTGAIADSINYAVGQLRELVSAITGVTVEVTSSTEASKRTVDSLAEAAKRQTDSINSVHGSIRDIGNGINQVNENARKTLDVAKNSVKTAVGGAAVVKDTIKGMDSIRGQIQDTSKRIKRLGESSQEIGGFVAMINDIAEHTNTLSLNAAIQAAMAGDAGKGFAVVADEVHALAERSSEATRKIESLVKVIQGDINEAVQSMEQTTTEVVSGTRLAQSAGKALDNIQRVSRELQELVDSITEASSNQTKAAKEITDSMDVIHDVTSNTAKSVEDTKEFMANLGALSERLQSAVAGFSLGADSWQDRAGVDPAPVAAAAGNVQELDDARGVPAQQDSKERELGGGFTVQVGALSA